MHYILFTSSRIIRNVTIVRSSELTLLCYELTLLKRLEVIHYMANTQYCFSFSILFLKSIKFISFI